MPARKYPVIVPDDAPLCACDCGMRTRLHYGRPQKFVLGHSHRKRSTHQSLAAMGILFDSCDEASILSRSWSIGTDGYPYSRRGKNEAMHNILLRPPPGYRVDHINRNRLDHRRCNLRLVTQAENSRNIKTRSDNSSGFRGVGRFRGKRRARIKINGVEMHLGVFASAEEAGLAALDARMKLMPGAVD